MKIFELVNKHCGQGSDRASVGSVAAWKIFNAPYFQGSMGHLQLVQGARQWKGQIGTDIELVQLYRDEHLLRTPLELFGCGWGRELYTTQKINEVPRHISQAADEVLEKIRADDPGLFALWFEPTAEQLRARGQIQIDVVNSQDLGNKLEQIIGPSWAMDSSLRTQGIEYHSYDYNDRGGQYILAHNGNEVAGILYLSSYRAWTYGINYLSVAPSFRQMGVSKQMYTRAVEICQQDKKVLVRTPSGEFAAQRPAIPSSYDQICIASDVLHVQSSSTLMSSVGQWMARLGYDKTFELAKPLCDEFDAGQNRDRSYNADLISAIDKVNEQLNAQPGPKRAKP